MRAHRSVLCPAEQGSVVLRQQFQHEIRACAALLKPQKAAALRAKTCEYRAGNRLCPAMRAIRNNISFPPHFAESASAPRIQGSKPGVVQTKRKCAGNRAFPSAPALSAGCALNPAETAFVALSAPAPLQRSPDLCLCPRFRRSRTAGMACAALPTPVPLREGPVCVCASCPTGATPRKRPAPPFRPLRRFRDGLVYVCVLLSCQSNPAETVCAILPAPAPLRDGPVYVCVFPPEQPRGGGLHCPSGPCDAAETARTALPAPAPLQRWLDLCLRPLLSCRSKTAGM